MIVVEKDGLYLPSKLLGELRAAGVPVEGVTATENDADPPVVCAVQIIGDDDADPKAIDTVCAAHDPTPAPAAPDDPLVPASVAVKTAVAAAMATVGITSKTLTDAQKADIETKVTAAVQAVVDEHLAQ